MGDREIPAHQEAAAEAVGVARTSDLAQAVGVAAAGDATNGHGGGAGASVLPAFDDHHPPGLEMIDECVHCGFCLATCPTYVLWGEEMDSPRGRIYLMKEGVQGEPMNATMVRHFDQCLGCLACVSACPSGVQYGKLLESTRQQVERRHRRPLATRFLRDLLYAFLPYPDRLRALLGPLTLYQRSGLQRLVRRSGLLARLPDNLRTLEALAPSVRAAGPSIPRWTSAVGVERRRVGVLLGCVQRTFFADVNAATVRVLAAEGCGVAAPRQGCCGALSEHVGREAEALRFARRTIDAFEAARVDTVVVNVAGCGSTMKEYGYLLRDDPAYADRARRFSERVRDVSELLEEMGPVAERHPLPVSVVYHDACHLQHGQGIRAQPRDALRRIPDLTLREVPRERDICCGSAGTYNILQPTPARELGDRKARAVLDAGAEILVTANPGCHLQIQAGLRRMNREMPAVHVIELIDASIRGASIASLLENR